jgi:DNA replication protein DnaC
MACPFCDDTGWKPVEDDGVRRVVRCDCWRENVWQQRLSEARIPPRYRSCDFSTFKTYENEKLLRAIREAKRFSDNFPVVDKGLLFIGPPGIGKTHLAVAVLRQAIRTTGARGLYYDTRELFSTIRATYNPLTKTAEADVIRPVMEAQLLVLDDLGAERLTDWVEETMNLIVNSRYNAKRPTIFTSNHEDVPDQEEMDSLFVRVGFRMHSRLREMCEFLEFDGPDYRDLPPNVDPDELNKLYKLWKSQPKKKFPHRAGRFARAQLREPSVRDGKADLKWPGGRAGS